MVVEASLCVLGVQRSLARARFGLVRLLSVLSSFFISDEILRLLLCLLVTKQISTKA